MNVPDALLPVELIDGEPGPWLLVEAFLEHRDRVRGRRVWGFVRGFLANAEQLWTLLSERPYLGNDLVSNSPSDMTTFAREIPWSAGFAAHGDLETGLAPYHAVVKEAWDQPGIEIELLGHEYNLEAERTTTNTVRGHWVPSHSLSAAFDLRERPGSLDLVGLDGLSASLSRDTPADFEGKLLYIRQDLVDKHAGGERVVIQLAWGRATGRSRLVRPTRMDGGCPLSRRRGVVLRRSARTLIRTSRRMHRHSGSLIGVAPAMAERSMVPIRPRRSVHLGLTPAASAGGSLSLSPAETSTPACAPA